MPRTAFSAAVQAKLYYPRYYRLEISAGNWCDGRMPAVPVGRYRPFPVRDTIADAGPGTQHKALLAGKIIDRKRLTTPFPGLSRRPVLRGLAAETVGAPAPLDGWLNRFVALIPTTRSLVERTRIERRQSVHPWRRHNNSNFPDR